MVIYSDVWGSLSQIWRQMNLMSKPFKCWIVSGKQRDVFAFHIIRTNRYNTRICGWILTQISVPVTLMGDEWGNDVMSRVITEHHTLRWRHNGHDIVSNHQPHDCLLSRLFRHRSRKHQSSASLAFVWGIHRGPVNSPHKWPVTRKMFPFDDVIMRLYSTTHIFLCLRWYSIESITYEPLHKSTQYR